MRDKKSIKFSLVRVIGVLLLLFSTSVFAGKSVVCKSTGSSYSQAGAKKIAYNKLNDSCVRGYVRDNCAPDSSNYNYNANELGGPCYRDAKSKLVTCYMDYEITCDKYKKT